MKRLLRLTALALGLTLLLSACGHKNTEPERKDAATQTVPVEGITGLTLCDGDVTLRFEKDEEGSWIWHDDPTFPLEQSAMDELLALPAALDGGETVTDGQELSVYGLETPAKYITVTADGEDTTYYVGEETTDGRWYVLTPDGRVLYASAESKALLSRSIYDMAVLPQLPQEREAVHAGQHGVQHQQVVNIAAGVVQPGYAVIAHVGSVALPVQQLLQGTGQPLFVLHDEYAHGAPPLLM